MLIRWTKSQSGTVLDDKGLDYKGNTLTVPYLKQDGNQNFKTFGGFIDIRMCGEFQKAKLVGFTGYSVDDGQTWVKLEKDTYLVGVFHSDKLYVVLFDGVPRSIPYTPLEPVRYYNNVVDLAEYRTKR